MTELKGDALEKARLEWARGAMPETYVIVTPDGTFSLSDEKLLEQFYRVRDVFLRSAQNQGLTSAEAGFIALELSATLLANQLDQPSYIRNAEIWHRSVRLDLEKHGVPFKPLGEVKPS